MTVSGSTNTMFLARLQIALNGRRTLLIASSGWTGACLLLIADCELWVDRCLLLDQNCTVLIEFVQGRQGGSTQGDCQRKGLSGMTMIRLRL